MDASLFGLFNYFLKHLSSFLLVEVRIASAFAMIFFLRREWVPSRLMIGITFALSFFIICNLPPNGLPEINGLTQRIIFLLHQGVMGAVTALVINFFVEFFVGFGQIIAMQAGLGFVNFFVPKIGNISPLTQFFMLLATMVFFSLNGHLVVISMMVKSLMIMPNLPMSLNLDIFKNILEFSGILFEGSVMLSLSVMFSVMLSNMTLAILTKFSPQLNLFSIGINISLIICFFIVYLSFDVIIENGSILFNQLIFFVEQLNL